MKSIYLFNFEIPYFKVTYLALNYILANVTLQPQNSLIRII